jgi:hypothetical protein
MIMGELFEKLAEVITASSSKLGLVALMVILTGFLAYKFFEKRSEKTQVKVFGAFGAVLAMLALVILLVPEGGPDKGPPENPPPPDSTPPVDSSLPDSTPQDTPPPGSTDSPSETPPPPIPAPVEAWIQGADLRRAVELVGGSYRVLEEEDACTIETLGHWVTAQVKAGFTGNKCEFQFQHGITLDERCRITEWDFDEPSQSKFKWLTQPRSGREALVHFRMWSDIPGREVRLSLKRVRFTVPGTAAVSEGELSADAFYAACLAPAG